MDNDATMFNFPNDMLGSPMPGHAVPPAIANLGMGLGENGSGYSNLGNDFDFVALLDSLSPSDFFVTSPGPSETYSNTEAMDTDSIPHVPVDVAPVTMGPAASAGEVGDNEMEAMEATVRLGSMEIKQALAIHPYLGEERLGSLELPSRNSSGQISSGQQLADSSSRPQIPVQPVQPLQPVPAGPVGNPRDHVTSGTDERAAQGETPSEQWPLPEFHEFKVVVHLMTTRVLEEDVKGQEGCILCYQCPDQAEVPRVEAGNPRKLQITTSVTNRREDGSINRSEIGWLRENHKKYTIRILDGIIDGVLLFSDGGDLFAKRQCRSKIFWTSTQHPDMKQAEELKRDTETKIFDWDKFENEFKYALAYGKHKEFSLPCVRFSFAQKWNIESETFFTKLVTARIEPARATEVVRRMNPDVEPVSHSDTLDTDKILISTEKDETLQEKL